MNRAHPFSSRPAIHPLPSHDWLVAALLTRYAARLPGWWGDLWNLRVPQGFPIDLSHTEGGGKMRDPAYRLAYEAVRSIMVAPSSMVRSAGDVAGLENPDYPIDFSAQDAYPPPFYFASVANY